MLKPAHELKNKHAGKPVAILGGGPNLPDDLLRLPAGCITIGINHHASRFLDVDYLCFCDSPKHYPDRLAFTGEYVGRRLTFIAGYSDWDVTGCDYLYFGRTFPFAAWAAEWMGADPILLCGFDCFMTGEHFYDDPESFRFDAERVENELAIWKAVRGAVKHPERIRAVSGPLVSLFENIK